MHYLSLPIVIYLITNSKAI